MTYHFKKEYKAFTIVEILIVIIIIGILSTLTLRLNRSKIKDMEAMNDKEQRSARHKKENNILTNTNFINGKKISKVIFTYTNWSWSIIENISGTLLSHKFRNHIISGNVVITKKPLELWCSTEGNKIELIWPTTVSCFMINTALCIREICK
jgi:prepilin-type N-terminal cleavage/methylation domain-containing protein